MLKAPPIDAKAEAEKLIASAESGNSQSYRSEHYKHVLDIKQLVPVLNPNYVAYIERNISVGSRWISSVNPETGKKSRWNGSVRGHAVHITVGPDIMKAALHGALADFCKENNLQGIIVGGKKIV